MYNLWAKDRKAVWMKMHSEPRKKSVSRKKKLLLQKQQFSFKKIVRIKMYFLLAVSTNLLEYEKPARCLPEDNDQSSSYCN
jgi:hypothetical protein